MHDYFFRQHRLPSVALRNCVLFGLWFCSFRLYIKSACVAKTWIFRRVYTSIYTFLKIYRSYENCSHFWYMFSDNLKNIFKICSYVQKIQRLRIPHLKITIYNTQHTQNVKLPSKCSEISKNDMLNVYFDIYLVSIIPILYILYTLYILYILYILYYIYIYIYIYVHV